MNLVEIARNNFDSWNRHDADAIVAAYAEGGAYFNPDLPEGITGAAISDFVKGLWTIFPDLSLDLVSRLASLIDPKKVVYGGKFDAHARYLDPTILYPIFWSDKIMADEISGRFCLSSPIPTLVR